MPRGFGFAQNGCVYFVPFLYLAAFPQATFVNFHNLATVAAGLASASLMLRADLRRRAFSFAGTWSQVLLTTTDVTLPALLCGGSAALIVSASWNGEIPLYAPLTWASIAAALITVFLWTEGRKQLQFQRPPGIVSGEAAILTGAYLLIQTAIFRTDAFLPRTGSVTLGIAGIVAGGVLIGVLVPPFVKSFEGHRIIERLNQQGEAVQAEYVPPTPECPHPERWKMVDSQTAEVEVLEFLKSVVRTVKPALIVETGTFIGNSAIQMAEALRENGFGRIITIEYDPAIFAKAKERIDTSGVHQWIEYRNASSLESKIDGTIDIFFSDSHLPIREAEIRKFLPQINPQGLILVHDASSHFQVVREAVLKLEAEGLISTVLLSTPRGMVVAQKREGRK